MTEGGTVGIANFADISVRVDCRYIPLKYGVLRTVAKLQKVLDSGRID